MLRARAARTALPVIALAAALAAFPAAVAAHPPDAGTLETVVAFDAAKLEMPESVEIDREGNLYVSLSFSGEVRKIAPYIGNGAYSILGPSNNTPSIMRLHLGVPGAPDL